MKYYLDTEELAKELGVVESTIDFWRRRKVNPLPCVKIGKHVRFIWTDVQAWIETEQAVHV